MKEKVAVSTEEQELHINYYPSEMGKRCEIYTTIPRLIKYLDKMVTEYPEEYKLIKDDQYGVTVTAPFKLVKPRVPRKVTEGQKQALIERLAAAKKV